MREDRLQRSAKGHEIATLVLLVSTPDCAVPVRGRYKNLSRIYKYYKEHVDSETSYLSVSGEVDGLPYEDTFRLSDIVGMRLIKGDYNARSD